MNINFSKSKHEARPSVGLAQNPKVLEVNLIKDQIEVDFDFRRHLGTLFMALLIAAIFLAEVYFGLNWWVNEEKEHIAQAEEKFSQVSREIRGMKSESDEILAFKQRVDLADALLAKHIYWTNFFNWLEKNTLSSVRYGGFSGGDDGVYELQATAGTFRDVSWQARAFLADSSVKSVRIDQGSNSGDTKVSSSTASEVTFSINLKIDPQLFKAATEKK